MQQSDFQRFRNVMTGMAKLYERELDTLLLDAYWLALRDWSLTDFECAAAKLMRTSKFMPRPADFNELKKALRPSGASAWFTKGTSDDPVAIKAMQIATQGRYVGHIPVSELQWVQKRFIEAYDELSETSEARLALPLQQTVAGFLSDR